MNIAILAWGSLVWDPRTLRIKNDWRNNGPKLEIEFSRVSKDGRLTLVVDPENGVEVSTYYAKSIRDDLGDAIADLRDREGTIRKRIGFVDLKNNKISQTEFTDHVDVFQTVEDWCNREEYDAAVWTALPSQFKEQTKMEFTVGNAISYLCGLPISAKNNAIEYLKKAPVGIATPVRKKIERIKYEI